MTEPKYKTTTAATFRIDNNLLDGIDEASHKLRMSKSAFVNAAIAQMVIDTLRPVKEGK
jgi:predicted transcriptional regulator